MGQKQWFSQKMMKRYNENLDRYSEGLYLYDYHWWMTARLALLS